ncbi:MAG: ferritin-like domain-containing protein [Sphingomonadales bacterium]|nr:ferritin-like domain-containing protein [Sphingomonadales bacterium]
MLARFRRRYLDVLASIYLYNEHRGYTSLDRVLTAVRARCPDDRGFIAAIEQHRADEEKHYRMFRRWFERQGRMPLAVDRGYGHIDHFIAFAFRVPIEGLDTGAIVADPAAFERLCRVIALTEQRGLAQVEVLRANAIVNGDPVMRRIFAVIHADEPRHFLPYIDWLGRQRLPLALRRERWADWCIHKLLMLWKLPLLFLNPWARRLEAWPDAADAASAAG